MFCLKVRKIIKFLISIFTLLLLFSCDKQERVVEDIVKCEYHYPDLFDYYPYTSLVFVFYSDSTSLTIFRNPDIDHQIVPASILSINSKTNLEDSSIYYYPIMYRNVYDYEKSKDTSLTQVIFLHNKDKEVSLLQKLVDPDSVYTPDYSTINTGSNKAKESSDEITAPLRKAFWKSGSTAMIELLEYSNIDYQLFCIKEFAPFLPAIIVNRDKIEFKIDGKTFSLDQEIYFFEKNPAYLITKLDGVVLSSFSLHSKRHNLQLIKSDKEKYQEWVDKKYIDSLVLYIEDTYSRSSYDYSLLCTVVGREVD